MKTHLKWFNFQQIYLQGETRKKDVQIHILPGTRLTSKDSTAGVPFVHPDVLILWVN